MDILPKSRRFGRPSLPGRFGRSGRSAPPADGAEATPAPVEDTEPMIDLTERPAAERRAATHGRHEQPRGRQRGAIITESPTESPTGSPSASPPPAVTAETAAAAPPSAPMTRAEARAARTTRGPGRAGRNLPVAVGVGAVLGALVIASLFIRKEAFVVLAVLAIVVAVWELTEALALRHIAVPLVPVAVGAVGMLVAAFSAGGQALAICFALTGLGILVWRVAEGQDGAARDVSGGLLVAAYVPLLGGFTMLLLSPHDGPWRELAFVLMVVGSDTGGYVAGVLAGKHPMAPTVSPKKSWEGFAGSVVGCVLLGIGAVVVLLDGSWWAGALTGLATVAAATVGDLGESLIKRDLGIKDMGSLLPGHGGVLDRIDSLLFAAPVVWLMLQALVPVT
jgi:phosphatidate cytidylyltransferase